MWLCCDTHCSVALKPQSLQAFDLQLWQKKQLWVQSDDKQQYRRTPIFVVPQASMSSTQRRDQGVTLSPNFSRNVFQPSSTVNSNFAGRGIYMPQSINRGSGHASNRNREAVMLALQGRYVLTSDNYTLEDDVHG